jgi:hypothetical protein
MEKEEQSITGTDGTEPWQVGVLQGMKLWDYGTKPTPERSPEYMPKPGLLYSIASCYHP